MEIALLALHTVVGALFIGHGAQKLFGSFGGHGLEGTAGFFESIGLAPGRFHATAAGIAEFGGGVLLLLGFLVPFAAAAIIATMVAAIAKVHASNGVFNESGGYEFNLVLIAVAFALAGAGAGAVSLDAALGLDLAGPTWAVGSLLAGVIGGIGATVAGARRPRRPSATTAA